MNSHGESFHQPSSPPLTNHQEPSYFSAVKPRRYTGLEISFPPLTTVPAPVVAEMNACVPAEMDACDADDERRALGGDDSKKRKRDDELQLAVASDDATCSINQDSAIQTCSTSSKATREVLIVLPSDVNFLSDHLLLLFAQVKRGFMNRQDSATFNRSKGDSKHRVAFPGIRCRHCGGEGRGSYFPTSIKHLGACTPNLLNHLTSCEYCPPALKHALRRTKVAHKYQASLKPPGSQAVFFSQLFQRIHDESFAGVDGHDLLVLEDKLKTIVDQSDSANTTARAIPNAVSYEDAEDQARQDDDDTVSEDDFEVALDLLRRPPTPDNHTRFYGDSPGISLDVSPAPVSLAASAISSGEHYESVPHTAASYASERFDTPVPKKKKTTKKSERKEEDDGLIRKFTRAEEILLMRGMMRYGEVGKWQRIWNENPGLQHIKRPALRDRSRSNRFKKLYERAKLDPTLLDRPEELCGKADRPEYVTG